VDLSELYDLSEDGFCVQTAPPSTDPIAGVKKSNFQVNDLVRLCLDLPETKNYVHGSGVVIWRADDGRVGIRFSFLTDHGTAALKEWLFVNLLVACSNYAVRSEQLARYREETQSKAGTTADVLSFPTGNTAPERGQLLSVLDQVRREVRELQTDGATGQDHTDAIVQLLAERAATLTGATGSALALIHNGQMVCRGRAGEPAPLLGSVVNVQEGISGECVRTGRAAVCADTQADARVDAALCRVLGIGSFLAFPIVRAARTIGLIETFSPAPGRVTKEDEETLARLAELIPWEEADRNAELTKTGGDVPNHQNLIEDPEVRSTDAVADATHGIEEMGTDRAADKGAEAPVALTEQRMEEGNTSLDDLRAALWDRAPALEQETAAGRPTESPEMLGATRTTSLRSRAFQIALIFASVAVVAFALGYLLAPVIEKRLSAAPLSLSQPVSAHPNQPDQHRDTGPPDLHARAEKGDAEAQFMLGTLYRNGDGVRQDDQKAVEWFHRSADQGYPLALSALGSSYWAGRGVHQDYAQAYFFYELALAEGDQNSEPLLEGLATQLTREQIVAIRQQAEAWLHAHNQSK
jgi:GAF domain-containing protein